jgi:dihydroneopterin aldolase
MKKISVIHLRAIELNLHLGWPEAERKEKQIILVDLHLHFSTPPKACETDDLKDTYCYDQLIQKIVKETTSREFRLIEYLAQHIYQIIRLTFTEIAAIQVAVSKKPAIPQLTGGVVFSYGDA